jgi:hypothetical protein
MPTVCGAHYKKSSPKPALGSNRKILHVLASRGQALFRSFDPVGVMYQPETEFGFGR